MVAKGISNDVAEYMVLGTNHAEIGARILESWSMPSELVHAVAWHHDPEQCEASCLFSDLVHVANIVVRGLDGGKGGSDPSAEVSFKAADRLGLRLSDIAVMAAQTQQEWGKLAEILAE
jgi:HD-like signal output (HDOD) protein